MADAAGGVRCPCARVELLPRTIPVPCGTYAAGLDRNRGRARHRHHHRHLIVRRSRSADSIHRNQPADQPDRRHGPHRAECRWCSQYRRIVAQTEHQLDTDLYHGRKEYSDDLNDGEQLGQTSTQALTVTGPSQRANITNDAKFDSANVSQQQSGFTLNFAPNAVLSASGDDACCGTKPNK